MYWKNCSEELEAALVEELAALGRSLEEAVCVVYSRDMHCFPEVCSMLDPPPAVHATFLFSHWCSKAQNGLGDLSKLALSKGWPLCVQDRNGVKGGDQPPFTVAMRGHNMSDADVNAWCAWFKQHLKTLKRGNSWMLFQKIDFSDNRFGVSGMVKILKLLQETDTTPLVLKTDFERGTSAKVVTVLDHVSNLPGATSLSAGQEVLAADAQNHSYYRGSRGKSHHSNTAGDENLCVEARQTREEIHRREDAWLNRIRDSQGQSPGHIPPFMIRMTWRDMDDGEMERWCSWFSDLCKNRFFGQHPAFNTIDFSFNWLTDNGVQTMVNTFVKSGVEVKYLCIMDNVIEDGQSIARFLNNQAELGFPIKALHLSHNRMGANAAFDIIMSASRARTNGKPAYPCGSQPLWLRIEHNTYWRRESPYLEKKLSAELRVDRKKLDNIVCTAHLHGCSRETCQHHPVSALHALYLFRHRNTLRQVDENSSQDAERAIGVEVAGEKQLRELRRRLHGRQQELLGRLPTSSQLSLLDEHSLKKTRSGYGTAPSGATRDSGLTVTSESKGRAMPSSKGRDKASLVFQEKPVETYICLLKLLEQYKAMLSQRRQKSTFGNSWVSENQRASSSTPTKTSSTCHCLLPSSFALTWQLKAILCKNLTRHEELWPGKPSFPSAFGPAVIQKCSKRPVCAERKVAVISFQDYRGADAQLKLTSDHSVAARKPGNRTFKPTRASELNVGDWIRTFFRQVNVLSVREETLKTEVVEVELGDLGSTVFVGDANSPDGLMASAVEIFGEFAMSGDRKTIKIFTYRRFDRFEDIFLRCEELDGCRNAMQEVSVSVQLSEQSLGSGWMCVGKDIATRAIINLRHKKVTLKATQVVVSEEYEALVQSLIQAHSRRVKLTSVPELLNLSSDLPSARTIKQTFCEIDSGEASVSSCVHSEAGSAELEKNPRRTQKMKARKN